MGCPPVRGDNPRALASGLSYVQVDKHGTVKTFYTDILYNSKLLYNVISISTNISFSLNLSSLQQKLNLTSYICGPILSL